MLPKARERLSRRPQLPVVEVGVVEPQHARLLLEASFNLERRGEPSNVPDSCSDLVSLRIPIAIAVTEADLLVVGEGVGSQYGFGRGVGRGARGQKADLAIRVKVEGAAVEGEAPETLDIGFTTQKRKALGHFGALFNKPKEHRTIFE